MSDISVSDAEGRLAELIEQVARGEEVVLTRDGGAVAKLVPVDAADRALSAVAGLNALRADLARRGVSMSWAEIKKLRDEGRR